LLFFISFEFLLMPFVHIITFFNILYCTPGIFSSAAYFFIWAGLGPFYLMFMLIYDTFYLIKILSFLDGCRSE